MQNFRALGLCPQTLVPPAAGSFAPKPSDPHWPPAAGGSAFRPPKQPPPLRISGYAPACILSITNAAAFAIVIKTARTRSRDHGQPARNL